MSEAAQKELRERRNAIAVAIRDAYDWPENAEPWWPVFLRAADRVLALESAQRPEQGEREPDMWLVENNLMTPERAMLYGDDKYAKCAVYLDTPPSAPVEAPAGQQATVPDFSELIARADYDAMQDEAFDLSGQQQCPECGAPVESTMHLNLEPGWKYAPAEQDGALMERLKEMADGKRRAKQEKIGIPAFDARRDAAIDREIETLEAAAAALATRGDAPLAEDMEAFVESVESAIGMGRGAWDMVDHHELVRAIIALADGGAK